MKQVVATPSAHVVAATSRWPWAPPGCADIFMPTVGKAVFFRFVFPATLPHPDGGEPIKFADYLCARDVESARLLARNRGATDLFHYEWIGEALHVLATPEATRCNCGARCAPDAT